MNRCPIHNKPLVRTHGGKLICFPCYFEERRENRKSLVRMTDPQTRRKEGKAKLYQERKQKQAEATG